MLRNPGLTSLLPLEWIFSSQCSHSLPVLTSPRHVFEGRFCLSRHSVTDPVKKNERSRISTKAFPPLPFYILSSTTLYAVTVRFRQFFDPSLSNPNPTHMHHDALITERLARPSRSHLFFPSSRQPRRREVAQAWYVGSSSPLPHPALHPAFKYGSRVHVRPEPVGHLEVAQGHRDRAVRRSTLRMSPR